MEVTLNLCLWEHIALWARTSVPGSSKIWSPGHRASAEIKSNFSRIMFSTMCLPSTKGKYSSKITMFGNLFPAGMLLGWASLKKSKPLFNVWVSAPKPYLGFKTPSCFWMCWQIFRASCCQKVQKQRIYLWA